MPRSNAFQAMSSLAEIGLLDQPRDSRYRLGNRLAHLAGLMARVSCPGWQLVMVPMSRQCPGLLRPAMAPVRPPG